MITYKLSIPTPDQFDGLKDHFGVIESSNLTNGVHNIVYIGQIADTFDEEGNPLTFKPGYHVDIHADRPLDIPDFATVHTPEHPVHSFWEGA